MQGPTNEVERGYPRFYAPGDLDPDSKENEKLEVGRVYISKSMPRVGRLGQYFEGVTPEIWNVYLAGYQVCHKWLKDRKGRTLSPEEIAHYHRIVTALHETIRIMGEIDEIIDAHGSWPGAFRTKNASEATDSDTVASTTA